MLKSILAATLIGKITTWSEENPQQIHEKPLHDFKAPYGVVFRRLRLQNHIFSKKIIKLIQLCLWDTDIFMIRITQKWTKSNLVSTGWY